MKSVHLCLWLIMGTCLCAQERGGLEAAFERAGARRPLWEQAWEQAPEAHRPGFAFLLAHMPAADLAALEPARILDELALAFAARERWPWATEVPEELFFEAVLPYANVSEPRDPWRAELAERAAPLVEGCATASEAVQALNERLFKQLGVRYSTERLRADQSPRQTIDTGLASCTGLSILLVAACRAVGIPARLVGVPSWTDDSGNHTWVEVWDGEWRFTGAAEPDPRGLDHGWFVGRAAGARADQPRYAVWAVSYRHTGALFPLAWQPGFEVPAVNVTARYAGEETADDLRGAFAAYFAASPEERAGWSFDQNLAVRTDEQLAAARAAAWEAFLAAELQAELRADFAADRVRAHGYESPYTLREVGTKPAAGWPLVIAMHGGGGVDKRVNDSQWRIMQRYYRDQDELEGYLYLALRAPTNAWNGFYTDYVYPLIERLLLQLAVCAEVDLARVSLIGYSHGGYGAFAIGPKMPDRFAAVHASAAAPTDAQTSPVGLHHLPFTFMIGEHDTRYGRLTRCRGFAEEVAALQEEHEGLYPVAMEYREGYGHGGLPDRDKLAELVPHVRDALPRTLHWELTDAVVGDHYWLEVPEPVRGLRIDARCEGNRLTVTSSAPVPVVVHLDNRLVDVTRPVEVVLNGVRSEHRLEPSLEQLAGSLLRRGDPELAATVRLVLEPRP